MYSSLIFLFLIVNVGYVITSPNQEYVYYPEVQVSYKFYKSPKMWADARLHCLNENATLAMPKNNAEANTIKTIFEQFPRATLKGVTHPDNVLLGFHDMFTEGDHITDTGHPIQYFYHTWSEGQPDNINNEDCGAMLRNGKVNDYPCATPGTFICQREDSPYVNELAFFNDCSVNDPAYKYEPTSGKWFKLHMDPKTWDVAMLICRAEGGHLAMIDSKEEEDFLVNMFNDPNNKVTHVKHTGNVLLGFHDIFKEGNFVTVTGEELAKSKYVSWGPGNPSNSGGVEHCGAMLTNGKINDFPCTVPVVYFCQHSGPQPTIDARFAPN